MRELCRKIGVRIKSTQRAHKCGNKPIIPSHRIRVVSRVDSHAEIFWFEDSRDIVTICHHDGINMASDISLIQSLFTSIDALRAGELVRRRGQIPKLMLKIALIS